MADQTSLTPSLIDDFHHGDDVEGKGEGDNQHDTNQSSTEDHDDGNDGGGDANDDGKHEEKDTYHERNNDRGDVVDEENLHLSLDDIYNDHFDLLLHHPLGSGYESTSVIHSNLDIEDPEVKTDQHDFNQLYDGLLLPTGATSSSVAAHAVADTHHAMQFEDNEYNNDGYEEEEDLLVLSPSQQQSVYTRDSTIEKRKDTGKDSSFPIVDDDDYILGTLIVRVVAARDLPPVQGVGLNSGGGGLGSLFFGGGGGGANRTRSSHRGGSGFAASANPYAMVRFGSTTQRTSDVYGTLDPTWPRGEAMYMDVIHPSSSAAASVAAAAVRTAASGKSKMLAASKVEKGVNRKGQQEPASKSEESRRAANRIVYYRLPKPILTVAIFHSSGSGKISKLHSFDGPSAGDSDDVFLGMAAVDVTQLITGKIRTLDEWLPLTGINSLRASVRVVCEYEPSDSEPNLGDMVRFTGFCHPADLFPCHAGKLYKVDHCEGDDVIISYTSQEGWVSSFVAHRFMLICEERHQNVMDFYHDELASFRERLVHSPLINAVQESVSRVPDEGLVGVSAQILQGGVSLFTRWLQQGPRTIVHDVAYATNWDGRFNPSTEVSLATSSLDDDGDDETDPTASTQSPQPHQPSTAEHAMGSTRTIARDPLPDMPSCPITGEPMRDPVVAADGHTYERRAIARWLQTSDTSPLTGSILSHKNLVPNYMLLSSLQERQQAQQQQQQQQQSQQVSATNSLSEVDTSSMAATSTKPDQKTGSLTEEEDHIEVNIND